MKKLLSLLGLTFMMAFTLTGCELYFGKSDGGDDGGDRPPGWACDSNADCAAGCFCEGAAEGKQGECAEAGFCDTNADCPEGYVCDDRSSCVPGNPPATCTTDADCAAGSICNNGLCEATCVCENDAQAQAAGYAYCDETTHTCHPPGNTTCNFEPTCGAEPTCPVGSVGTADSASGCWSGQCSTIAACDVTPKCSNYQYEADCFNPANGSCSATYTGINCRKPDGSSCTSGSATDCVCESFVFATCRANAN
jgi:hypothetical protein